MTEKLRIISYGGGVQSTAMIVLAVQERIGHVDAALFSNVGDDSEHPATLDYVRNVMIPWAAERGLPVHELRRTRKDGSIDSLWTELMRPESRSIPIPVRMSSGAPGTRNCTDTFKIKVIGKWLKAQGCGKTRPAADVLIGISVDEIERAGRGRDTAWESRVYPLLDLGLSRSDCEQVIRSAGLPVPPKSSCFFCPFHRPIRWAEMRRDEPDLFNRSQQLEDVLNERREKLGKDSVYLTRFNKRLTDAVPEAQTSLFVHDGPGEDGCDSGYCWT